VADSRNSSLLSARRTNVSPRTRTARRTPPARLSNRNRRISRRGRRRSRTRHDRWPVSTSASRRSSRFGHWLAGTRARLRTAPVGVLVLRLWRRCRAGPATGWAATRHVRTQRMESATFFILHSAFRFATSVCPCASFRPSPAKIRRARRFDHGRCQRHWRQRRHAAGVPALSPRRKARSMSSIKSVSRLGHAPGRDAEGAGLVACPTASRPRATRYFTCSAFGMLIPSNSFVSDSEAYLLRRAGFAGSITRPSASWPPAFRESTGRTARSPSR